MWKFERRACDAGRCLQTLRNESALPEVSICLDRPVFSFSVRVVWLYSVENRMLVCYTLLIYISLGRISGAYMNEL